MFVVLLLPAGFYFLLVLLFPSLLIFRFFRLALPYVRVVDVPLLGDATLHIYTCFLPQRKQVFRRVFQLDAELHHPQGPQASEPAGDARLPREDHRLRRGHRESRRPALHPGKEYCSAVKSAVVCFVVVVAVLALDLVLMIDTTVPF